MHTGIIAFDLEWSEAQKQILSNCAVILSDVGMSPEGLAYVQEMKGYPRIPYLSVNFVLNPFLRKELGIWVCVHAIGIKLIDDLLDRDQPISHWDQALGIYILQKTAAELAKYDNSLEVAKFFAADYQVIWKYQIEEMRYPADTLSQWVKYARIKSGLMMANYAAIACTASSNKESIDAARIFAEAVGVLFMIGDDFRDYQELGERNNNLRYLVELEHVDSDELREEIQYWEQRACSALFQKPVAHDLSTFVEQYSHQLVAQIPVTSWR